MITSGVIVVAFNDAAAMTPIVTNKCEERGEGEKERGREGAGCPAPFSNTLIKNPYQTII